MYEILSPYLNDIITAVLGLITFMILTALTELRKRVLVWIDSRNDLRHQEIIKNLATDAFSYVETSMKGKEGSEKLKEASAFVSRQLADKKINYSEEQIIAAVEKAVLDFKKDNK
jgi:hypothetical protein